MSTYLYSLNYTILIFKKQFPFPEVQRIFAITDGKSTNQDLTFNPLTSLPSSSIIFT